VVVVGGKKSCHGISKRGGERERVENGLTCILKGEAATCGRAAGREKEGINSYVRTHLTVWSSYPEAKRKRLRR